MSMRWARASIPPGLDAMCSRRRDLAGTPMSCACRQAGLRAARRHVRRGRGFDPGQLSHRLATHSRHGRPQGGRDDAGSFCGRRVGVAATQIAKHLGAKVIGTASAVKHPELRALGVDHLIDYRTEDFEKRAREITHGRGVELILDAVGGESSRKVIASWRPRAGSEFSALRRRRRTRAGACSAWCRCSPARLGFNSIRSP